MRFFSPRFVGLTLAALLASLSLSAAERPRNVILIIGDGMGYNHLTAARLLRGDIDQPLAMEQLPVVANVTTTSAGGSRVTDSAAAATAMATGHKTSNGRIATLPDGASVPTLFETLRARGWSLGIVTDGDLNGATAGAFTAHADSRDDKPTIARQMIALAPDFMLGTTAEFYFPTDAAPVTLASARSAGLTVFQDVALADLPPDAASPLLLGYTAMVDETASLAARQTVAGHNAPTLTAAFAVAVKQLQARDRPFFLLFENDWIDSWSHENAYELVADSVVQLDDAVAAIMAFAERDGHTLMLITADHECGGLTLRDEENAFIGHHFSTEEHTAATVTLFAYGPGADRFAGSLANTDIHRRLRELLP